MILGSCLCLQRDPAWGLMMSRTFLGNLDIGKIALGSAPRIVGIDHERDPVGVRRFLVEEVLVLFRSVALLADPLSGLGRAALQDDVSGLGIFLADEFPPLGCAGVPDITNQAAVDRRRKTGKNDIELGGLIVFTLFTHVSPLGKFGHLPAPADQGMIFGPPGELFDDPEAVVVADEMDRVLAVGLLEPDIVIPSRPLLQPPSFGQGVFDPLIEPFGEKGFLGRYPDRAPEADEEEQHDLSHKTSSEITPT